MTLLRHWVKPKASKIYAFNPHNGICMLLTYLQDVLGTMFVIFPSVDLCIWIECYRTLLMISQCWFRYSIGCVRQQVIAWDNSDTGSHSGTNFPNFSNSIKKCFCAMLFLVLYRFRIVNIPRQHSCRSDHFTTIWMKAEWNFHWILIMIIKSYVKWTQICVNRKW